MKRAWVELILVSLTGAGHLVFDTALKLRACYITAVVIGWAAYVVWRLREPGQARDWGMRLDTIRPAAAANGVFLLVAGLLMVGYGLLRGRPAPSAGFFYLMALYPAWGLIQQLLLYPLIYSNLERLSRNRAASTLIGAALFGLVHVPDWSLAVLTTTAAVVWIAFYQRWPSLWAQAVSHGWLGALVYHYVLGRNPWAELLQSLGW